MMNHFFKGNLISNHVTTNCMWTRTMTVLIALMTTATAWAELKSSFTVDGVRYRILTGISEREVELEELDVDDLVEFKIPATVSHPDLEGDDAIYKVTSIATNAFTGKSLKSVTISSYVKTIKAGAFQLCKGLTSITIPSGVTTIGDKAFYNCTGLEKVTIGYDVASIGNDAFKGCTNVGEVFCNAPANSLTWTDNNCDDFKTGKATICYVSNPSDYSTTLSNVNVTVRQYYDLDIAGTRVTVDNKADILGHGEASYNSTSNTLTLKKDITYANGWLIKNSISGLTIEVADNVTLESTSTGSSSSIIVLFSKTTITGSGVLTLKGYNGHGVEITGSLTIDKAVINISGTRNGFYVKKTFSIKGSAINVSCTERAVYGGGPTCPISMSGCHISYPEDASIKNGKFVDAGGNDCKSKAITILPDNSPGVFVSEMVFPDENFRNWLLSQDYGKTGYITAAGLAGVTTIDVSKKNIATLKGIECFTTLKTLNCKNNQLTALDISANTALTTLDCSNNQLSTLVVSANTALTTLDCSNNQLTALDVTKNTALTKLICYGNQIRGKAMQTFINSLHSNGGTFSVYTSAATDGNEINTIQVGEVKAKKWQVKAWDGSNSVDYAGIHAVTIDDTNFPDYNFRENWILKQTFADDNYLNDKEAASVTAIDISSKGIADLKGIEHFTALKTLNCSGNYLTTLDVSKNTALTELYCFNNQIRDAAMLTLISSLHQNGGTLCAYATENDDNEMTTTNVADAKAKKWQVKAWDGSKYVDYAGIFAVYINATNFPDATFRNYVGDFDQNKNGYLTEDEIAYVTQIIVPSMNITSLKGIEHFTALTYLDCNGNQLTALDVSTNKALENLICTANQLSVLDVKANKALIVLYCSNNKLTTLDVSENIDLTVLYCEHNQLTALDLTKNTELSTLYCYGNKIAKGIQTLISSLRQNGGELVGYSSENDGNKITTKQVAAAGEKGWTVYMMVGSDLVPYDGILLGDANGDNKVDVADIVAIVSHQKGKDVNGFSLPAADVNNDDKADEKDIELILPMIMGE